MELSQKNTFLGRSLVQVQSYRDWKNIKTGTTNLKDILNDELTEKLADHNAAKIQRFIKIKEEVVAYIFN